MWLISIDVSVADVAHYSVMYKIVIDDCVMISGSYILLSIVTYTQLIPPSSSPFTKNTPSPPPPGTSDGASIMTGVDNYLLSRAVTVFTILSAETPSQWSQIHLVSVPHTAGANADTDTTNTNTPHTQYNSFTYNICIYPIPV